MTSTENKLLAKWSINSGLSSSLLSSSTTKSLTTSTLATKSSDIGDRKRKNVRGKSAEAVGKKKPRDDGARQSELLSTGKASSMLQKYSVDVAASGKFGRSLLGGDLTTKTQLSTGLGSTQSSLSLTSSLLGPSLGMASLTASLYTSPSLQASTGHSPQSTLLRSPATAKLIGSALTSSTLGRRSVLTTQTSVTSNLSDRLTGRPSSLLQKDDDMKGTEGRKVKGKKITEGKARKRTRFGAYVAPPPSYSLSNEIVDRAPTETPRFVPPDRDSSLLIGIKVHDVNGLKFALINAVSGSLICQPNFSLSTDPTRVALVTMSQKVICYDPEFILKVALYTRKQLNIRTTGNFLLAMASHMPACRPYLRKYYSAAIALPSDWIEVAEVYQAFPDKTLPLGSIPSALRRVMVAKFPDFDKYQLAKYNKESSKKKKRKKMKIGENDAPSGRGRGRGRGRGGRGASRGRGADRGRGMDRGRGAMRGRGVDRGRGRGRGSMRGIGGLELGADLKNPLFNSDSSSSSDSDSDEEYQKHLEHGVMDVVFDDGESREELEKKSFSLKQLIRKLHITEPVEHVMCLIGKKYPNTIDEFYRNRLPDTFEEERAGKRMKLPVPETWETQVSLKGNKASTWEQLLDHKKLPFMAMLRNLRNLIKAGVSGKHHTGVLRRLTDERSVINSKQFPFRFFSAYEVLEQLERDYQKSQQDIITEATTAANQGTRQFVAPVVDATSGRGRGRGRGRGKGKLTAENWWIEKRKKKQEEKGKTKETQFDSQLITRYRKALDTAVKIATVYNVQPIRGRTVILCDQGSLMDAPCTAARGLGKTRTLREVGALMGLMCKYACEESVMVIYDSDLEKFTTVDVTPGTILENMENILTKGRDLVSVEGRYTFQSGIPMGALSDYLRDRIQVDNLLVLSSGYDLSNQRTVLANFLDNYRRLVNPDLLYVYVSFVSGASGFDADIKPEHDNNIYMSGFSDQILRFIAERGDGGQLRHVENIDKTFNLKPLPNVALEKRPAPKLDVERPLPVSLQTPSWRTARVFISSTFRDMHGERDLLTRFVFPELRALGKKHFINVYEVDLRWGVTEEDTRTSKTLELCLSEIARCQMFVGILGERYGWVPEKYLVPDTPEYDWVREYPPGASVTELEMFAAALSKVNKKRDTAFFFLRDPAFEKDLPKAFREDFLSENSASKAKMDALKSKIRGSGLEVFDNYSCRWEGVVDGKPLVSGLDMFGSRALNNLWTAVQKYYPDESATLDENSHTTKLHDAFVEDRKSAFVGRKKLLKDCVRQMADMRSGVIGLVGKPGCGKSSLLARLVHDYMTSKSCDSPVSILTHIVGAAPGSTNILATLRRLCHELNTRFSLHLDIPEDYNNVTAKFGEVLTEAAILVGSPLVVFMDGLDMMEPAYLPHNLDWLPETIPQNVIFVMTAVTDGQMAKALQRRSATMVTVDTLDMWDKADVVRTNLATHRKTLDESPFNNQLKLLVAKKEASLALYLQLACQELRVFGVFEKITAKLKSLSPTVSTLLQEVLGRIETDLGPDLVSTALTLVVCSRDGLEVTELHDLLNVWCMLGSERPKVGDIRQLPLDLEKQLPAATFARLQRALQQFLNPADAETWSGRLSLAHSDIMAAVRQRYLKGAKAMEFEMFIHRLLAGHLYSQADPDRNDTWQGKSARAFTELPYHLSRSGSYGDLETVVCSLRFIYAKCMLGLAAQLIDDYQEQAVYNKPQEREQAKFLARPAVLEYKMFVSRNLHVLASHPALTWQQAVNEANDSRPSTNARTVLSSPDLPAMEKCYLHLDQKPAGADPCYLTLSSLPDPMTSVCVSQNQQQFACGGLDGVVHLYDITTGKEVRSFRGHSDTITDVCFAGADRLCSASLDSTISIWDVQDGHRLFTLTGHGRRVNSCSSDLSGKMLATASWDCIIKVWSIANGKHVCEFKVGSPVNCVAFHPEGQLIVSGTWDSCLKIWDIFHKKRVAILRGHTSSVRDVAYSPSGRHIASAALDGDVKLWAAYTGTQVGNVSGHTLPINKLIFSPSGKELITVSDDHKIKVWSGHLGKRIKTFGQEDYGPAMSVAISPERDTLAVGYHSGVIRTYDVQTGAEVSRNIHSASIRSLVYTSSSSFLISGSDDTTVKIINKRLRVQHEITDHTKPVMCVAVCTEYLATASEDCTARLYQISSSGLGKSAPDCACVLSGHIAPVTSCSFSQDGQKLATGSRDMSVRIWEILGIVLDPEAARPARILHDCHADWVTDCRWSNTGDFLVTASTDFNLKVWDVGTGVEKHRLTGHMAAVNHVQYKYGCIMSTCTDGSVKVWSHKGVEITTLYGHTQRANGCDMSVKILNKDLTEDVDEYDWASVQDSDDSTPVKVENVMVATCSDDGTARLWFPLEAEELACLTGHSDKVLAVASTSQGQLCTSSLDKTVKLWSHDAGSQLLLGCHDGPVTFVCSQQAANRALIVTGSRDGVLKLWQSSSGATSDYTCVSTIQAHEKAVTCGCWVTSDLFMTGSDDATVVLWNVQRSTLVKKKTHTVDSPVLAMVCTSSTKGPVVFTSEWSGTIHAYNLEKRIGQLFTKYSGSQWLLKLHINDAYTLCACTTDGYVLNFDVKKFLKEGNFYDIEQRADCHLVKASAGEDDTPEHKRTDNWVLDMAGTSMEFWTTDSKGHISHFKDHANGRPMKIHAAEVCSIVMDYRHIFTASKDHTIKVWKQKNASDVFIEQLGQLSCESHVTSMCLLAGSTTSQVPIVYGNQLGQVHFLSWKTGQA